MHRVYSTCVTPSGECRGRAESNKADLNYFLHLTQHKQTYFVLDRAFLHLDVQFDLTILGLVSDFSLFLQAIVNLKARLPLQNVSQEVSLHFTGVLVNQ